MIGKKIGEGDTRGEEVEGQQSTHRTHLASLVVTFEYAYILIGPSRAVRGRCERTLILEALKHGPKTSTHPAAHTMTCFGISTVPQGEDL